MEPAWHCRYTGALANETALNKFSDATQTNCNEANVDDVNDNLVTNVTVSTSNKPSNFFYLEMLRYAAEICSAADTGPERRLAALEGMQEVLVRVQELPVDVAKRPEARYKSIYERI